MLTDQNYQKKVEAFVVKVSGKYINRKNIFGPLSEILPNYWNDIFLSSVKKIMFKRVFVIPASTAEAQLIWVVKDPARGTVKIAKEIIEYERLLKKMIYRKNDWGDPYYKECPKNNRPQVLNVKPFEYKYVSADGYVRLVSLMDFKRKYTHVLRSAGIPDNVNDGLLEATYKTIVDAFDTGHDQGVKSSKFTRKVFNSDMIIDVYNNIELAASDLKKIIDES
jgi:hypothetical protein